MPWSYNGYMISIPVIYNFIGPSPNEIGDEVTIFTSSSVHCSLNYNVQFQFRTILFVYVKEKCLLSLQGSNRACTIITHACDSKLLSNSCKTSGWPSDIVMPSRYVTRMMRHLACVFRMALHTCRLHVSINQMIPFCTHAYVFLFYIWTCTYVCISWFCDCKIWSV